MTTMTKPRKVKPRTKTTTEQSEDRNTITYSISFDREIFEIMEAARRETRIETPRSAYVRAALEEKFKREGRL